jgi:hypothetical protein
LQQVHRFTHSNNAEEKVAMNEQMQACIQECQDCHSVCLQTVVHCLEKGGKDAEAEHIRLMLDCAEICQTSANFMLRGSELHTLTCEICDEICSQCADSCEQFGDDAEMRACAETCRRCAESCQTMADEAGVE